MDVETWLRGLGLGQYEQAFRENDIDARVLPGLTADDLKEIGVASVGHRRLMLQAVAALSAAPADPVTTAVEAAERAPSQAERRQLTVMFVDLVGSTALSGRLDPEDMRSVLLAYQNTVAGEITRFGGHVAKYLGDGVLAYFGWPRAHEDEAERAVRAGLAIAAAVGRLAAPAGSSRSRRGSGSRPASWSSATCSARARPARRRWSARHRTWLPGCRRRPRPARWWSRTARAGSSARCSSCARSARPGSRASPGRRRATRSWASGPLTAGSRPAGRAGLPPMVGRDQELALVLERWRQAAAGEGQAVLLVGEAGIGKSRLVRAVLDALAGEEHAVLRYQCSPHHTGTALWPVAQQLGLAAGLDDRPRRGHEARQARGAATAGSGRRRRGGAAGRGAARDRRSAAAIRPESSPRSSGVARTLAALVEQLLGLARRRPVLMVLEDAHWIDPTTLELVGLALDRIAGARVLVLLTSRPDGQPALGGHPHVTRLTLNRLGRGPTEAIVAHLAGSRCLPPAVLGEIAARTDGVPLFVEELTKAVLEAGAGAAERRRRCRPRCTPR